YADSATMLQAGIEAMDADPRFTPSAAMYSYLGVALARTGDLEGAIAANEKVVEKQPNNTNAMLNLALLYRDTDQPAEGIPWVEQALSMLPADQIEQLVTFYQLANELYQATGQMDQAIAALEQVRQWLPNDVDLLAQLSNL